MNQCKEIMAGAEKPSGVGKRLLGRCTRVLCWLLIGGCLTTCLDEIDLAQGTPLSEGIVVSGRMLAGEEINEVEVEIQQLFRFEGSNRGELVASARVSVVNSDGQVLPLAFAEDSYRAEVPVGDPDFRVEDGMTFAVNVNIPNLDSEYFSEPEPLMAALPVGELSIEPVEVPVTNLIGVVSSVPAIEYNLATSLRYPDGTPAFFRWYLTEIYQQTDDDLNVCYTRTLFERLTLNLGGNVGNFAATGSFKLGVNPIDFKYAEGHYLEVRQEMLSEGAFTYLDKVNQEANRELSIFEAPGGPILGNMRAVEGSISNVYGYFYITRNTVGRVPTTPAQADFPDFACPLTLPDPPANNRCAFCGFVPGASLQRPVWWNL